MPVKDVSRAFCLKCATAPITQTEQGKAVRENAGSFTVSAPDSGRINRNEAKHFSQKLDILHELKGHFGFHEMACTLSHLLSVLMSKQVV